MNSTHSLRTHSIGNKKHQLFVDRLSYSERAPYAHHPKTRVLCEIMARKKTNLALAADLTNTQAIIDLIDQVGPYLCMVKIHADIIDDFSLSAALRIKACAQKHDCLVLADRKCADIGNTVRAQVSGGVFRIAEWADLITSHSIAGPGTLEAIQIAAPHLGVLLLAQMSSANNLIDSTYTAKTIDLAQEHRAIVSGFIAQQRLWKDKGFLCVTPGINLVERGDAIGQKYSSIDDAIITRGSDVVIVGRGIYGASQPVRAAQQYQELAFSAYMRRLAAT